MCQIKDGNILIKGIIETVISSQKPNTLIKSCLSCNSSTLQESQVAETGTFPVYGATGISGYTEAPDVNGESILIIKDGSGVGTVKHETGEYSYIGTLNSLTAKDGYCLKFIYFALQNFVLSHIKQEWQYHTSILKIMVKLKSIALLISCKLQYRSNSLTLRTRLILRNICCSTSYNRNIIYYRKCLYEHL